MRRVALLLATTLLACVRTPAVPAEPATPAPPIEPPTTPADAAEIGNFGFDTAGMDRSIRPGVDFYGYANGGWTERTPIPADKSNYGVFSILDDISRERTRVILEEARRDPASKIGAAYASFLDEAAVERLGLAPLAPWIARIKGIRTRSDYLTVAIEANRHGVALPFAVSVGQDDEHPDVYAMRVSQSGLGMPDRDYYLLDDAGMKATRAAYLAHLERMLTLAGEPNASARAAALLEFEARIAGVSWSQTDSRDALRTYNVRSLAQLRSRAPGLDFARFFRGIGADVERVIVAQPSAVEGIARLVARAPLGVLRDALLIRTLDGFAEFLPRAFVDASFAFHGTTLSGTPELEPRWKRAVSFTSAALGDEVGKLYVARHFPPGAKAAADQLVKNVIAAMDRRIDRLDWMAAETKAKAHAKLAAFVPKIGYPDRWRDYSALEIRADDLLGNAMRSRRFDHDYEIGKLGQPIYRWEWRATPMTADAFADYGAVEIVFPAAILQPPFYDPNADPAVNYGAIGASIGHELSHHFDDQGSRYDAAGKLTTWWTPEDLARFQALTDRLVRQYDAYEPLPGIHVNGTLTLGENIADLAGLTVAYDAYQTSLRGERAPVIDGFSGDQRFYLGWAQIWRLRDREEDLRQRLVTNPHSPSVQRVWVVRNLDPWYRAFAPEPGEPLYLDPARRVRIW